MDVGPEGVEFRGHVGNDFLAGVSSEEDVIALQATPTA